MRENKYGIGISARLFLGTIVGVLFAWQGVAFAQTPQSSPTLTRTAGNTISAARVSPDTDQWQWELSGVQVSDPAGTGDASRMGMITYSIVDSGRINGTWEIINGDAMERRNRGTVKLIVPSTHNEVIASGNAPVNNAVFRFIGQMPTTRTAVLMVSYTNPDGASGSLDLELEIPAYNQRPILVERFNSFNPFAEDEFPGYNLIIYSSSSSEGEHEGALTSVGSEFDIVQQPSNSAITVASVHFWRNTSAIQIAFEISENYYSLEPITLDYEIYLVDPGFGDATNEHRIPILAVTFEEITPRDDLPVFIQNGEALLTERSSTPIALRSHGDSSEALFLGQIPGMMEVVDVDHPSGDRTSTLTFTIQGFPDGTAGDWHLNSSPANTFHTGDATMVIGNINNLAAASEALNN